jgi:hypothetical protein
MIGEVDIYGVFVSPLLLWAPIAFVLTAAVRFVLRRVGFYRFVWHRPAFDLALFVILLGATAAVTSRLAGGGGGGGVAAPFL